MPPVDCSESLSVTSTKVEFCFTSNQSAALILTGQEGWGVIGSESVYIYSQWNLHVYKGHLYWDEQCDSCRDDLIIQSGSLTCT